MDPKNPSPRQANRWTTEAPTAHSSTEATDGFGHRLAGGGFDGSANSHPLPRWPDPGRCRHCHSCGLTDSSGPGEGGASPASEPRLPALPTLPPPLRLKHTSPSSQTEVPPSWLSALQMLLLPPAAARSRHRCCCYHRKVLDGRGGALIQSVPLTATASSFLFPPTAASLPPGGDKNVWELRGGTGPSHTQLSPESRLQWPSCVLCPGNHDACTRSSWRKKDPAMCLIDSSERGLPVNMVFCRPSNPVNC
uniref:Uncharacterized protein LOC110223306 n=1 Tax=Phascolarctos cinereus TaxID=38626 RepID=A0A6P5M130_PHACI|nr:uncharacterized protein LOC110223306 [Phascolarctos cinereus]